MKSLAKVREENGCRYENVDFGVMSLIMYLQNIDIKK